MIVSIQILRFFCGFASIDLLSCSKFVHAADSGRSPVENVFQDYLPSRGLICR